METPESVKLAMQVVAGSDMKVADKLLASVFIAHAIARFPEATEDDKLDVTASKMSEEDAKWWAETVLGISGRPQDRIPLAMEWMNLSPGTYRFEGENDA